MAAVTRAPKPDGVRATVRQIAIVGSGFSGTMVAVNLLRQSDCAVRIHIFEKNPDRVARGVAYGTRDECHLLNVPAGNMSALPDNPEHFLRWARAAVQVRAPVVTLLILGEIAGRIAKRCRYALGWIDPLRSDRFAVFPK